ncbi:MAG: methyltransferase domain-containing protein [Candidatus Heimdallarchaeota archaeon]|nr:methyltransferase domain-containing protein [Candidatus Heimdallarchaeota archaeon]
MAKIQEGDFVLLSASQKKKWMIKIEPEKQFHTHRGTIDLESLIGLEFGSQIKSSKGANFFLWKPLPSDYQDAIQHSTQVIYNTDAAQIILSAGACNGSKIIEAGTGSGGLTVLLAKYVSPDGRIYSYDRSESHQVIAQKNLKKLGLEDQVEFKVRDVTEGFDEKEIEAIILDLPVPWEVIPSARESLMGGGVLIVFVPTYVQVEQTIAQMKDYHFFQIEAFEIIRRDLTTRIGAIRPVTRMIGFTGFLITGRKGLVNNPSKENE